MLDSQSGYEQPSYDWNTSLDLSALDGLDLSGLDSTGQESDYWPTYDSSELSPEQYAEITGPATTQELISWLEESGLPMDQQIAYLQQLKVANGLVDPDAYDSNSPVVNPDEQKVSAKTTYDTLLKSYLKDQAAKQLQAKQRYDNSGLSKAIAGLMAAGSLAQAFKKNNYPTATARKNMGRVSNLKFSGTPNTSKTFAKGGAVGGKGGLLSMAEQMLMQLANEKGLIKGSGGGQDDVVDIKAAPGEYVMDAEVVSSLGDGNNEEGARKLDEMRMNIRKHKRQGGLASIPAKAKKPEQYLKGK